MSNLGILKKPRPAKSVTLPLGDTIRQGCLARLLRRSHSEVRRWLQRRVATWYSGPGYVDWLVDEVLVDALEEWGYDVETA